MPTPEHSCKCRKCVEACRQNPGWFLPAEALKAIEAGYADRLMRDWYEGDRGQNTYVLAPASLGHEGEDAPAMTTLADLFAFLSGSGYWKGQCTFLKNDLCAIHDSGFKPFQCRRAFVCSGEEDAASTNRMVARAWDTRIGRDAIMAWRRALQAKGIPK
jgi:Fe-S-cluster containining protein